MCSKLVEAVEPLSLSPESGEVGEPGDARPKPLLMAKALELKLGVSLGGPTTQHGSAAMLGI